MSTVLIVVIVIVVVAAVALLVLLPRLRERARLRQSERELDQRRERVVEEHHQEAAGRERRAEVAEQRARVAEREAQRERAEAQVQEEKATLHEKGLADHELIGDHEREEFAGTSAVERDDIADRNDRSSTTATSAGGQEGAPLDDRRLVASDEADDAPLDDRRLAASDEAEEYPEARPAAYEPAGGEDVAEPRRREENAGERPTP